DHHRHPAGPVGLVGRQLQALAAELAGAALDRPVDGVVGDRVVLGLLDGVGQGRVALGAAPAPAGRDLDRPDQLGEQLAPPGVLGALLVLDGRPLGMPAHVSVLSAIRPTSDWCRGAWPGSWGWRAVASSLPWRTATTLPSTSARTSTSGPASATQGARMNAPATGPPPTPVRGPRARAAATWGPKALRRTRTSSTPSRSWGGPSTSRAMKIMPAQVPSTGSPARARSRSGSSSPAR